MNINKEALEHLSIADIKAILDLVERKQKIFAAEGFKEKLEKLTIQRKELQDYLNTLIIRTYINLF